MILVVKDYAEEWIEKRNKEIEASTDKQAIVDISRSFERLYCRNIVYICFGEDISETEVEFEYVDEYICDAPKDPYPFTNQHLKFILELHTYRKTR